MRAAFFSGFLGGARFEKDSSKDGRNDFGF